VISLGAITESIRFWSIWIFALVLPVVSHSRVSLETFHKVTPFLPFALVADSLSLVAQFASPSITACCSCVVMLLWALNCSLRIVLLVEQPFEPGRVLLTCTEARCCNIELPGVAAIQKLHGTGCGELCQSCFHFRQFIRVCFSSCSCCCRLPTALQRVAVDAEFH